LSLCQYLYFCTSKESKRMHYDIKEQVLLEFVSVFVLLYW
jgi:hypothetical protein